MIEQIRALNARGILTQDPIGTVNDLLAVIGALEAAKNEAYRERDQVVAVLSKLWPSHLARHSGEWEEDWRNIVCIHSPVGQAAWHIHDSELSLFGHLKLTADDWDGHSTPEKYERLGDVPIEAR